MKIADLFPKQPKIFISYRREPSSDFVNLLAKKLKEKFTVFYDQNSEYNQAGEIWPQLQKAINKCSHFVLVVDKDTFNFKANKEVEDIFWREIDCALKRHKKYKRFKIIPFIREIKIIPLSRNGNKIPSQIELKKYGIENFNNYSFFMPEYNDDDNNFDEFTSDFIEKQLGYDESKENKKKKIWQSILAILAIVVAAAGLVFGGTLLQKYITSKASKTSESVKLVFAGGGSVANMIKIIMGEAGDSVDIRNYDNSIYLNLPSQDAWALMPEEVMNDHTLDTVPNKFYPVCLSALQADSLAFLKIVSRDSFIKEGTVISYYLGEDDLRVYIDKKHKKELDGMLKEKDGKKALSLYDLSRKIKDWCDESDKSKNKDGKKLKPFRIYITQKRSGTYYIYNRMFPYIFKKYKLTYYDGTLTYDELNDFETDSAGGYVVLSSQFYTPKKIESKESKLTPIMITKTNSDSIISKPMYLYFAGYYKEKGKITIPNEMVHFLNKLDHHFNKGNNKIIIKPQMDKDKTMVITPYNTLKSWQKDTIK